MRGEEFKVRIEELMRDGVAIPHGTYGSEGEIQGNIWASVRGCGTRKNHMLSSQRNPKLSFQRMERSGRRANGTTISPVMV
jgi:hypothetical protein